MCQSQMTRILLVDDHQILLDGLYSFFKDVAEFSIVGIATNSSDALDLVSSERPDLVITDIEMPEVDGIEFTRQLKRDFPEIKVLALTMYNEQAFIKDFLRAGGNGYILKNADRDQLFEAVQKVLKDGNYLSPNVMENFIESHKHKESIYGKKLSEREISIIQLIADELTTEEIADKLHLSALTIKTHRKNIFLKLGIKNSAGLIKYAMRHGLIN